MTEERSDQETQASQRSRCCPIIEAVYVLYNALTSPSALHFSFEMTAATKLDFRVTVLSAVSLNSLLFVRMQTALLYVDLKLHSC